MVRLGRGFPATRVVKSRLATGAHYSDGFNRADTASLGANWTNRNGTMGVYLNNASGYALNVDNNATYNSVMATDHHKSTVTISAWDGSSYLMLFAGSGTDKQCYAAFGVTGTTAGIYTSTNWSATAGTLRASAAVTISVGDVFDFVRNGNVWTLVQNGTTLVTWTDTGNYMPADASHRMVGVGGLSNVGASRMDNWQADDL